MTDIKPDKTMNRSAYTKGILAENFSCLSLIASFYFICQPLFLGPYFIQNLKTSVKSLFFLYWKEDVCFKVNLNLTFLNL